MSLWPFISDSTKVLALVLTLLHLKGIPILRYLNDLLMTANSYQSLEINLQISLGTVQDFDWFMSFQRLHRNKWSSFPSCISVGPDGLHVCNSPLYTLSYFSKKFPEQEFHLRQNLTNHLADDDWHLQDWPDLLT